MTRPTTTGKAQDLITFTRSTTGTYLDSVTYGDELVTNGDFATDISGWENVSVGTYSLTVSSSGLALQGTNSSNRPRIYQQIATETGKSYKATINVTSYTSGNFVFAIDANTSFGSVYESVIPDSEGAFTFRFTATGNDQYIWLFGGSGGVDCIIDNISVKEVIGGQGTQGTPLLRTSAINEARIEYDASGNCLGLLVEEARTNLLQYSNQANQISYHNDGATTGVDTAEVTSPEGSGTVIKLNKTSGGYGFARVSYSSITNAQTLSAFVKKGTARYIGFRQLAAFATHTTFDLETNTWVQTIGSTSRGYEDYGNGWLRLWVVSDDTRSKTWASICITNSGGTETNYETGTVYVYGIQRESGSFPTSYIPTSGSTVTRAADVASLAVSEFGYNQDQGTVVAEAAPSDISSGGRVFSLNDGTGSNVVRSQAQNSNHFIVISGGAVQGNIDAGTFANNTFSTLSGAYKQDDIAACIDGGAVVTDTSATIPTITNLSIGQRYDGNNKINGHIKSIQYYPLRLSNAQLQALTV